MCARIGTIVKLTNGKFKAIKVTCRSWSCESCRVDRKRKLISQVREGRAERLITLTVNPHWFDSPEERAKKLVHAWRIIRRRFFKRHPNSICEFMAIFEKTRLGEPHLHIVQRGAFISQKWLSLQLEELIGAKIVDIRYVRNQKKVALYVSKYVGKEPHQFGSLKRYWRSKNFLTMTEKERRRQANAGSTFYILDCHWKGYLRWCLEHFPNLIIIPGTRGFEMEWPDEKPPPWCLLVEPIICPEL